MSGFRLLVTSAAMAVVAGVLHALAPDPATAVDTLRSAQQVATTTGPDTVVLAAVGLAAWLAWAWGVLGLLLTAATALPGAAGVAAHMATRVVLPAGVRSSAAVALGIGLVVATPVLAPAAAASTVTAAAPVRDWPVSTDRDEPFVPDWPVAPSRPEPHVVVRGDCLWQIAAERLRQAGDRSPTDGDVATAVESWWQENRAVIGSDPDLIHPGQVLQAPAPSPAPTTPGEPR